MSEPSDVGLKELYRSDKERKWAAIYVFKLFIAEKGLEL